MDKNSVSGGRGRGRRERLKYSQLLLATKKKPDNLWPFQLVTGIQDLHPQNPWYTLPYLVSAILVAMTIFLTPSGGRSNTCKKKEIPLSCYLKKVTITLFLCSTNCPCVYISIHCKRIKIHSMDRHLTAQNCGGKWKKKSSSKESRNTHTNHDLTLVIHSIITEIITPYLFLVWWRHHGM